jgi:hypothetical protein
MRLQPFGNLLELGIDLRHLLFMFRKVVGLRMPATTSSPWALIQKIAFDHCGFPRSSPVARQGDAGQRCRSPGIAEDHGDDIDRRAQIVGDAAMHCGNRWPVCRSSF